MHVVKTSIFAALMLCMVASSWAVRDSISLPFQAWNLTTGIPINGSHDVTVYFFDDNSPGSPVASDTHSVDFLNGVGHAYVIDGVSSVGWDSNYTFNATLAGADISPLINVSTSIQSHYSRNSTTARFVNCAGITSGSDSDYCDDAVDDADADATNEIQPVVYNWGGDAGSNGTAGTNTTSVNLTGQSGGVTTSVSGSVISFIMAAVNSIITQFTNQVDFAAGLTSTTINSTTSNATNFYGDGSGITGLNADNIASGTLDEARIDADVARDSEVDDKIDGNESDNYFIGVLNTSGGNVLNVDRKNFSIGFQAPDGNSNFSINPNGTVELNTSPGGGASVGQNNSNVIGYGVHEDVDDVFDVDKRVVANGPNSTLVWDVTPPLNVTFDDLGEESTEGDNIDLFLNNCEEGELYIYRDNGFKCTGNSTIDTDTINGKWEESGGQVHLNGSAVSTQKVNVSDLNVTGTAYFGQSFIKQTGANLNLSNSEMPNLKLRNDATEIRTAEVYPDQAASVALWVQTTFDNPGAVIATFRNKDHSLLEVDNDSVNLPQLSAGALRVDSSGTVSSDASGNLTGKAATGDVGGTFPGGLTVVNTQGLDYHNVTSGIPNCDDATQKLDFDGTDLNCVTDQTTGAGIPTSEGVYGEMTNGTDGTHTIPVGATDTFYQVTGFSQGDVSNVTFNATNQSLRVKVSGVYMITWAAAISGGPNDDYEISVFTNNDTEINDCEAETLLGSGGDVVSLSSVCLADLSADETITLKVEDKTSAADVTFHHQGVVLQRMIVGFDDTNETTRVDQLFSEGNLTGVAATGDVGGTFPGDLTVVNTQGLSAENVSGGHLQIDSLNLSHLNVTASMVLEIVSSFAGNTISIDANADSGSSTSTGGVINLDNTDNIGAGLVLYTNQGASANGRLANFRVDNAAFDQAGFHVDYDGTANAVEFVHNGLDGSGQALNVVSTNFDDTSLGVVSNAVSKGAVKITHKGNTSTETASALSIDLQSPSSGNATSAQGIFVDATDAETTGKLILIRNFGRQKFFVDWDGTTEVNGTLNVIENITVTNVTVTNLQSCDKVVTEADGSFSCDEDATGSSTDTQSNAIITEIGGDAGSNISAQTNKTAVNLTGQSGGVTTSITGNVVSFVMAASNSIITSFANLIGFDAGWTINDQANATELHHNITGQFCIDGSCNDVIWNASSDRDSRLDAGNLTGKSAGGDLADTYPNATIAASAVQDDEIDYSAVTLSDFTNDAGLTTNGSDANFRNGTVENLTVTDQHNGNFVIFGNLTLIDPGSGNVMNITVNETGLCTGTC